MYLIAYVYMRACAHVYIRTLVYYYTHAHIKPPRVSWVCVRTFVFLLLVFVARPMYVYMYVCMCMYEVCTILILVFQSWLVLYVCMYV
jgi:hypothetical protein